MLALKNITMRKEKGEALTHDEMDMNMRILQEVLYKQLPAYDLPARNRIIAIASFDPALFSIVSGTTTITAYTSVEGHADRIAYEADPIVVRLEDWFSSDNTGANFPQLFVAIAKPTNTVMAALYPLSFASLPFEFALPASIFSTIGNHYLNGEAIQIGIAFSTNSDRVFAIKTHGVYSA